MFMNNCSGCLQVPTPVSVWPPYIVSGFPKRSMPSFQIADILHLATPSLNKLPGANFPGSRLPLLSSFYQVAKDQNGIQSEVTKEQLDLRVHRKRHLAFPESSQTFKESKVSKFSDNQETNKVTECTEQRHKKDTCRVNSALVPLQALCKGGFPGFPSGPHRPGPHQADHSRPQSPPQSHLKFGISRILSEEFGKQNTDQEKFTIKTSDCYDDLNEIRAARASVCSSSNGSVYQSMAFPAHALSAVHALQPPQYPVATSGTDTLPGPYSILNTDVSVGGHPKRKRSWSRAVFSNLQRKGLEKRFEVQKYVTKPDRRQLAAMLGLTDAQVKVWFQNRRMKWRHAQQQKARDQEMSHTDAPNSPGSDAKDNEISEELDVLEEQQEDIAQDEDETVDEPEMTCEETVLGDKENQLVIDN